MSTIPVTVSITLSKTVDIDVLDDGYIERDEDGNKFFVSTREPITKEDVRKQVWLPDEILKLVSEERLHNQHLFKKDCQDWVVDELEVIEE